MQVSHLYRITDRITGRYYIGKHNGEVQGNYWGSGVIIEKIVKKHGTKNLDYQILVISDENYILDLESRYVTLEYIKENPLCLNRKQGGVGGRCGPMKEETKAKLRIQRLGISPTNKGKKATEEQRLKLSLAKKGKSHPHTLESRKKIALAKIGNKGRFGIPHTEETKLKIAEKMYNRKKLQCPHCPMIGNPANMAMWHFDNCKLKGTI